MGWKRRGDSLFPWVSQCLLFTLHPKVCRDGIVSWSHLTALDVLGG